MSNHSETKRLYRQGFEQAAGRSPRPEEERSTADIRAAIELDLVSAEDIGYRDGQTARETEAK